MNLGGWKSWKHSLVSFFGMRMDCFAIDTDRRGEIVIACGGGTTGEWDHTPARIASQHRLERAHVTPLLVERSERWRNTFSGRS